MSQMLKELFSKKYKCNECKNTVSQNVVTNVHYCSTCEVHLSVCDIHE